VGEFYMEHENYRAAESRLREALAYNPTDARAMCDLAESLEKENLLDAATEEYRSCSDADPAGTYGTQCRKHLELVSSKTSANRHP
jgi:Tfp pilus assembly protein PilF